MKISHRGFAPLKCIRISKYGRLTAYLKSKEENVQTERSRKRTYRTIL
jgi:hypothetical protein